jgi:Rieske Fe-S protein
MSTQTDSSKEPTRRSFLGWWLGTIMAAAVVSVVGPLGVYLFPPRDPKLMKETIRVVLDTALANLKEGTASRFDAPAGAAFVMADGGENNSPGDPTFGGFLTREGGQLRALAITCPHLGCSYNFDDGKQHFLCPCHGSEFGLDGRLLKGPATAPLSHLTWRPGPGINEIEINGVTL